MHEWGDKWFEKNGGDLNSAINYCTRFWRKWGRIGSHGKEKYGTFRDHPYFWNSGLNGLIWPGYVRVVNKFITWKLDRYIIEPIVKFTSLNKLVWWYQSQIYNYAIQKMCKKYPNIIDELVSDLEGYKCVKPGIFGNIDGIIMHKKYWKEYTQNSDYET